MAKHLSIIDRALTDSLRTGGGRLILTVPPRHGKSELASKFFPAWYVGTYPNKRVILASYEADFAASWGRKARNILEEFGGWFGVKVSPASSSAQRWDIQGNDGGMATAGVGGPITGKGADVLIIDDPTKNYEDAHSETIREKTWDWFTSTAYTRLEPGATVIIIQTRWHEDDLTGRILDRNRHENWRLLNFPAIAEEHDALGRQPGDALWPARFPVETLATIRQTLGSYQWNALYQQHPTPAEGGMFRREWFKIVDASPAKAKRVRAWDKAGTEDGGAYTAGVLIARDSDGLFWIEDVVRGQWSSWHRNQMIVQTAELDTLKHGNAVQIWVEQEPGSGGKESAEITARQLAGHPVHIERVTGEKESRAQPFAAQAEAGNVRVVKADWNAAFLAELAAFPHGTYADQVDAGSMAFNKLCLARKLAIRV